MRLLILTQKVDKNDPILGFFHEWIREFSKNVESVMVICLEKGGVDLPENVKVFSLGKEIGVSKIRYVFNFYRLIWKYKNEYDSVFVHMNQIYVILGGLFWKMWGKRMGLWYTHKQVGFSLGISLFLTDFVFSASKKSFRIQTKKLKVLGHGIDTELFKPSKYINDNDPYILTVGRITKVKNIDLIIDAVKVMKEETKRIRLVIVGGPIYPEDYDYLKKLKEKTKEYNLESEVNFVGSMEHNKMPDLYQKARMFINLSDTGSLDKAILESMSCGIPVLTSNESFVSIFGEKNITTKNLDDITSHIKVLLGAEENSGNLRDYIVANHSLQNLIPRILAFYKA